MKSIRMRAIKRSFGYHKGKDGYFKSMNCFKCNGTGIYEHWVANGSCSDDFYDVETHYYIDKCVNCNGTGFYKDVLDIVIERELARVYYR